ncbi:MAG: transcriptional repressor [Nitrosopumilus sp.]|uniref:FUR family transcriptional regulator n=1 Tax=Nitrosopumilus zosterae TaxID=718286 RepID=A0A2S2KQM1_9ARCH|nr:MULTISPECIES: Fur family transcriptional regulator [Nitrosopumilus]MCV0367356.1 transcriptional repressor [Nitrosopumilus sp.]GBH33745.1 FUR family transcriptional regulator [Nitrosopumilus zosterae]
MQHLEEIVSSLRDEGFRITPQRIAIVDYLLKTEDHPSAELIHKVVRKRYPMVSLSTVYKTLDLLREKKLVNEIEVEGGARFDAHIDEHINLVCMKCGKIDDVDEDSLKEIQAKAAKKSKYLILKSNFELYGYCHNCKSKMK